MKEFLHHFCKVRNNPRAFSKQTFVSLLFGDIFGSNGHFDESYYDYLLFYSYY